MDTITMTDTKSHILQLQISLSKDDLRNDFIIVLQIQLKLKCICSDSKVNIHNIVQRAVGYMTNSFTACIKKIWYTVAHVYNKLSIK